jgi:hypothetical protein
MEKEKAVAYMGEENIKKILVKRNKQRNTGKETFGSKNFKVFQEVGYRKPFFILNNYQIA